MRLDTTTGLRHVWWHSADSAASHKIVQQVIHCCFKRSATAHWDQHQLRSNRLHVANTFLADATQEMCLNMCLSCPGLILWVSEPCTCAPSSISIVNGLVPGWRVCVASGVPVWKLRRILLSDLQKTYLLAACSNELVLLSVQV